MSEEYENQNPSYSVFWPALILLVGLLISTGYHVWAQNSQRRVYNQQFQQAIPTINQAEAIRTHYVALMKDLIQTGAKDQYAAGIVKEAEAAGLVRQQAPASTDTNSAPQAAAGTSTSSDTSK